MLLGLSGAQLAVVGVATTIAVAAVYSAGSTGLLVSAPVWGVLLAAGTLSVAGRPVVGWLPLSSNTTLILSPVRTIVFGLLIVLFLIFEPHGLAEIWRRIRRTFHLWPFRT